MDNSGDYISRDDGKVAAWEILEGMGYSITHNDRLAEEVDAVFDEIPAADVRPVVVCADCEYNNHCLTQEFVDDCGKIPLDRNTFFCADGERRSNA